MNQIVTQGIILARTDYGEADRILTLITPNQGKLRLMAKGVRRVRSKLAGGIELFSISDITFIRGRSDIGTLVSARLVRHYGAIVSDLARVQMGYELLRLLHRNTEDESEADYFSLLDHALAALNDTSINTDTIGLWFRAQLLRLGGFVPNLHTDTSGDKLEISGHYTFSFDDMAFAVSPGGRFQANHIKVLRLLFGNYTPAVLQKLQVGSDLLQSVAPLVQTMFSTSLRI
ncbi:MAG TPA: DNA repair protein RecO [Candidatus Saccharimonadales bacterium]|nr:DNA repair protein RecO [Candidatus Saccharimonadales bacterium]